MMEEKNNLVYWEERRINSLENEETNVQRNIFKYEIVRKDDLLDFIKCLFSNAFDVPERIDEMIIYYNDGTNEATNVFGKSKKRRYILEAMG